MRGHLMRFRHSLPIVLFLSMFSGVAAAEPTGVSGILEKLASVRSFGEVVISPDGKRVIYGTSVTGRQGGAEVDVSALWMANAKDGTGATRLTACPQSVCDEHGAAWSADGKRIAFVTMDDHHQPQIAIAEAGTREVKVITAAHGPLDSPRWSPDDGRIAFLYSEGAPKTPGA